MAAAVLPANHNIGLPSSTSASPVMDSKSVVKQSENTDATSKTTSPVQQKTSLPAETKSNAQPEDSKPAAQGTEPLAPPPRPAPNNTETPDYFSSVHNNTGISGEFNPFEQSFGAPSAETPGGTRLPPVAALTSPAVPGANTNAGYNWNNSLRSGPLSPAMLEGPTGGDYFGNISSRGFPTPNESSLRTGLTPGGTGSMFPAPSPNSQALFNSLASGGATPGTIDFHRTAMNAAARSKNGTTQYPATSGAQETSAPAATMDAQHDATDAANGLFMLAKGGQANQFSVPNQSAQQMQTRGQDNKRNVHSNGSIGSASGPEANESPDSQEDTKPSTRGNKKKTVKTETTTNGRRKSEATQKGSNKKLKGNNGNANVDPALDPLDDDDDMDDSDMDEDGLNQKDPKKMTDEEKRRNFLERNRVAALKCRQRKKQWLANLQAKVEMFSAENESLNSQVAQLHDEVRSLRTLLMGHKDCPVGHAQGIGQFLNGMQDPSAFGNQHVNPYGMGIPNGAAMQQGMQRS